MPTPRRLDGIVERDRGRGARRLAPQRPDAACPGRRRRGHGRPRGHDPLLTQRARVPARAGAGPARGRRRHRRRSSTTTPTSRWSPSSCTARRAGCTEVLLITLGTGIGGGVVTDGDGAAGRARVRRRDRALPGRPRRPALRVRPARPLGGDGVGHRARRRSGASGRPPGRAAVGAGAGGRRRSPTSRACSWATSPQDGARRRGRAGGGVRGTRRASAWSAWSTSSIPSGSWCRAGSSSSATCCSRPLRAAFDGRIEGAPYRPAVPIVRGRARRACAGVVGAAVLARELA